MKESIKLLFALCLIFGVKGDDDTMTKKAYDTDVVLATLRRIEDTCIFPNDYLFMRRIGWMESKWGRYIKYVFTSNHLFQRSHLF